MMLTPKEEVYRLQIFRRIESLGKFLNDHSLRTSDTPAIWYQFMSEFKTIQGNLNNDMSFISTLLAKGYLVERFAVNFDAAEKLQGAPGIDIDLKTSEGLRIVAEIKTTTPYQATDFGAQQAASFKKDFLKLVAAIADYKFLFVTDRRSFDVLKKSKYTKQISGVIIVLLPQGEENIA